jgi:hypothetical protein
VDRLAGHFGGIELASYAEPADDYKDAKRAGLTAKYITNTYDLGDGEIDFPACHRVLRSIHFKSWLCADLDITRNGPRTSYDRCDAYIVKTLEPIYV